MTLTEKCSATNSTVYLRYRLILNKIELRQFADNVHEVTVGALIAVGTSVFVTYALDGPLVVAYHVKNYGGTCKHNNIPT